jgi:hypothetical protein
MCERGDMTAISRQAAALPHTGIATFRKSPYVFEPELMDADVAILGVPFDNMTSMRPGCRQAPRALRDASTRFGWLLTPAGSPGFFDIGNNTTYLTGIRMVDANEGKMRMVQHRRWHKLVPPKPNPELSGHFDSIGCRTSHWKLSQSKAFMA